MKLQPLTAMVPALRAFWDWLHAHGCIIRDRDGFLRPLIPNKLQVEIFTEMLAQAVAGLPIRIIVLKSRKMGASTFTQALFYFLAKYFLNANCQTLAHTDESTADIFDISVRMYVEDPQWRVKPDRPATHQISFLDHGSDCSIRTGGGQWAASGANRNFVTLSEMGKWQGEPLRLRAGIQSILNSVPNSPFSVVVIESTANMLDDSGEFKGRCKRAETGESNYGFVFSPWFDEPTYTVPGVAIVGYDDEEIKLKAQFELSDAQLVWRRRKIADECNGEVVFFHQDYPSTPEDAWETPLGRVYGMLRRAEHDAHYEVADLLERGYVLRRGIDWGGVDPFVCLWIAINENMPPRFSIDKAHCPVTWQEHEDYAWSSKGRPQDRNDHTCDTVRYVVTQRLTHGHVHVFQELVIPMAAARGESLLEHAQEVKDLTGSWPIELTVCDRSLPTAITLFCNQGIPAIGYRCPLNQFFRSEKIDTIMHVQALMVGSHPLIPERRRESTISQIRRAQRRLAGLQRMALGETSVRTAQAPVGQRGRLDRNFDGYLS